MSESAGGTTLQDRQVADYEVEVQLNFQSRDYTLPELAKRIQDVHALMRLLLIPHIVVNLPERSGVRWEMKRFIIHRTSRFRHRRAAARYAKQRESQGPIPATPRTPLSVRVEAVSLHSPLELLIVVSGGILLVGRIAKLLPKFIDAKNQWNESRVRRAESNLEVERIALETEVVRIIAAEVRKIDVEKYASLDDDHPSKKIVKSAVRALSNLEKAEVRDR